MKRIYISFITLYHSYCCQPIHSSINILLHWCRHKKSLKYCRNFSLLLTRLTDRKNRPRLRAGWWTNCPLTTGSPPDADISIQPGLTCCDTRLMPHLIKTDGPDYRIRVVKIINATILPIQTGVEGVWRQPPMTEEKCLPEEATSEGLSPWGGWGVLQIWGVMIIIIM